MTEMNFKIIGYVTHGVDTLLRLLKQNQKLFHLVVGYFKICKYLVPLSVKSFS
jgi:hypothetical protein